MKRLDLPAIVTAGCLNKKRDGVVSVIDTYAAKSGYVPEQKGPVSKVMIDSGNNPPENGSGRKMGVALVDELLNK